MNTKYLSKLAMDHLKKAIFAEVDRMHEEFDELNEEERFDEADALLDAATELLVALSERDIGE